MKNFFYITCVILCVACASTNRNSNEKILSSTSKKMKISLAEWSLHKTLFDGKLSHLDFPRVAKQEFNIDHVEYVSQFFQDKANDRVYLQQMKDTCTKYQVTSHLIMVDGEGELGNINEQERQVAVRNHFKWIEAAHFLNCYAIRVNANGIGSDTEVTDAVIKSLVELGNFAKTYNITILVENHGMLNEKNEWSAHAFSTHSNNLTLCLSATNLDNVGALPDFGNFTESDPYSAVKMLGKHIKGASAKSIDFAPNGEEANIDFKKMFSVLKSVKFDGYIGIEYEGEENEIEGIHKTLKLVQKHYSILQ